MGPDSDHITPMWPAVLASSSGNLPFETCPACLPRARWIPIGAGSHSSLLHTPRNHSLSSSWPSTDPLASSEPGVPEEVVSVYLGCRGASTLPTCHGHLFPIGLGEFLAAAQRGHSVSTQTPAGAGLAALCEGSGEEPMGTGVR